MAAGAGQVISKPQHLAPRSSLLAVLLVAVLAETGWCLAAAIAAASGSSAHQAAGSANDDGREMLTASRFFLATAAEGDRPRPAARVPPPGTCSAAAAGGAAGEEHRFKCCGGACQRRCPFGPVVLRRTRTVRRGGVTAARAAGTAPPGRRAPTACAAGTGPTRQRG